MTLLEKQQIFPVLISNLILYAAKIGLCLTFGEAYRTEEQAQWNAKKGIGIKNSLHRLRLALDFNLFKDGKWLKESESFKALGKYWESLSTEDFECCWGGRFNDGGHFSISHNGIK